MSDFSKFQTGTGVYVCEICGKRTRDTGEGEAQLRYCKACFLAESDWCAVEDGEMTEAEWREKHPDHPI